MVNNKAYETMLTKANTPEYAGCDDASLPYLCGYANRADIDQQDEDKVN